MSKSQHLSGKVTRYTLPVFENAPGANLPNLKRLLLPQGELAQIHNSPDPIRYLAAFEVRAGGVRGNHYHKHKRESVYLISGEFNLVLEELETGERDTLSVVAGDLVFISPGVAHALKTVHPGLALEFAPEPLDPADTHRHALV
jgi:mannose-6-phosphate isomerase-like protein (cupin superfamily)